MRNTIEEIISHSIGWSGVNPEKWQQAIRLMRAAPDLLEAATAHIKWEAEEPNTRNPSLEQAQRYMAMMELTVDAIAKATIDSQ